MSSDSDTGVSQKVAESGVSACIHDDQLKIRKLLRVLNMNVVGYSYRRSFHFRALGIIFFLPLCSLYSQRESTPSGAFLERSYISFTQYKLSWGNVQFKRTLPDTFTVGFYDNPKFEWENPQYMCLRAESDTDCWYSVLLPFNDYSDYIFYTQPLAYDTINNYVAFPGDNDTLVIIEHISTGFRHFLMTWDRCGDQENYTCIRDVSFDPVRLEAHITWMACGSVLHPEVYATERTAVISLHP